MKGVIGMCKKLFLLLIVLSFLASCGQQSKEPRLMHTTEDVHKKVVIGTNDFGFQILRNVKEKEENILISPLSISLALAMTVNGADGDTKEAMLDAMQLKDVSLVEINQSYQALTNMMKYTDPKVLLSIANSLWGREDKSFDDEFIAKANDFYDAKLTLLDFQAPTASKTINNWVKEKTEGKIEEIVEDEIDRDTVLFLINAIYFHSDWQHQFNKNRTVEKDFFSNNGKQQKVKMMSNNGNYQYFENESVQGIRLPYGEGKMAMDVFLPREGMDQFLEELTINEWQNWMTSFETMNGYFELPRFTFEYEESLKDVLMALGMEVAFDEQKANFGKIAPIPPNLYISDVLHKTFIEVNEKGTEAAAVTSVEIKTESAPMFDFHMEVNRPFLFIIHDLDTGVILFIGVTEEID